MLLHLQWIAVSKHSGRSMVTMADGAYSNMYQVCIVSAAWLGYTAFE